MDVQFITSVAVITPEPAVSRRLYLDALGLPLTTETDGYLHGEHIDGCKSFGVWPLTQAAQACFGTPDWPVGRPVPQASVEFEVADADAVQVAADELNQKGFTLLHDAHTEPWGQTVARLQSIEGAIIGISYTPTMHATVTRCPKPLTCADRHRDEMSPPNGFATCDRLRNVGRSLWRLLKK